MALTGGQPDTALYVTMQSAYNKEWYLGFGPNPQRKKGFRKKKKTSRFHRGIVYTRKGYKATQPRKMVTHQKKSRKIPFHVKTDRCDFRFHTGTYTPQNVENEWKGLFEHILQNVDSNLATHQKNQKRKITKTANKISSRNVHSTNKSKVMSKFRTNPKYIASKHRKLISLRTHRTKSNSLKNSVKPISYNNLDRKEKMQSDQIKNFTNTLTSKDTYTNSSSSSPHQKFDYHGFAGRLNQLDGRMVSNDMAPLTSTWKPYHNRTNFADSSNTSKLLTDDIIYKSSLSSQNGNSQKPSNTISVKIQSDSDASPSSSSTSYKKSKYPSQNIRNIKISKHKSIVISKHEGKNISAHDIGNDKAISNKQSTRSDANDELRERTPFSDVLQPSLRIDDEILARRKKLLRRIHSLKQQKSVMNSKSYPIRNELHLKSGTKSIKARLRQRRLRLKYLRKHERPVNSYLYMHNVPRKVKRRLPTIKTTLSSEPTSQVTVN